MLKKIISALKKPWASSFLILASLSLLVWFTLPFESWLRMSIIAALVFIWGVVNIILQRRADKKEQELAAQKKGLTEGKLPDPKLEKATLDNLKVRFLKAISIVNHGSFSKGLFGRKNYALPWYLVLGAPGSGKTTLLNNVNLEIYQEYNNETNVVQNDIDPLCSWCFSKDAVFVDVDGQVFEEHDPALLPRKVWYSLLSLLKKYRSKKPLSGVILTIDVKSLLLSNEKQRQYFAFQFRQLLKGLNSELGVNCPVYCMFNKFDTVAGFNEYFDSVGSSERQKEWGITFEYGEKDAVGYFINEYDRMLSAIKEKLIERLQLNEWDQLRSGLINGFLLQMGYLRNILWDVIKQLYQKNGYYDETFLRGTYFLSSARGGVPVDYMSRILNPVLGLDNQPLPEMTARKSSTFARNLLAHFVVTEKNAITLSDYARKKLDIRKTFAFAAVGVVVIAAVVLWWESHSRGAAMMTRVNGMIAQIKSVSEKSQYQGSLNNRMPILNMLNQVRYDLNPKNDSFTNSWGLFEGGVALGELDKVYAGQLRVYLLPYLKEMLQTSIKNNDGDNQYKLFNDLQSYLMISMPKFLVPGYVENWLQAYWEKAYPYDQLYRNSLYGNLVSLLQLNNESSAMDVPLVRKARKHLRTVSLSQLSYYNLITNVGYQMDMNIKMQMMLNADFAIVFGHTAQNFNIQTLYSKQGYIDLFQPNIKNSIDNLSQAWWVLGVYKPKYLSPAQKVQIENGMVSLYMENYIDKWRNALDALRVVKFGSVAQADTVLQSLSGDTSPIKKILQLIAGNTKLKPIKVVSDVTSTDATSASFGDMSKVEQAFNALNDIITPIKASEKKSAKGSKDAKGKDTVPYDGLQKAFANLHDYIHALSQSDDPGKSAYEFALKSLKASSASPLATLDKMSLGYPEPLKRWIHSIISNIWGAVLEDAMGYVQVDWSQNVYPQYRAMIADKYPVDPKAKTQIDISDFTAFFGPGGIMDRFFKKNLAPFVDQTGDQWTWKEIEGHSVGMPSSVLSIFQNAKAIQDTFFPKGSKKPRLSFTVTPTGLDGTSQEVDISLNDQVVKYQHGPIQALPMEWPSTDTYPMSSVCFVTINGQKVAKTKTGPWAFFKLISSLKTSQGSSSSSAVNVVASFGGHRATFTVATKGTLNPFYPNILEGYELPESIQ